MARDVATLPYTLRSSVRAKHVRLVVKPTGLELVVPPHVDEKAALEFLQKNRDWAERKLLEMQGRLAQQSSVPAHPLLATGSTVPFQGQDTLLQVDPSSSRILISRHSDGVFAIRVRPGSVEEQDHQIRAALYAWVKRWLHIEATRIAQEYGKVSGLNARSIRIKQMKTRWGSCGPQNDINLNWLLAFTPTPVLEYVVVHELCHIRHRNHSHDFWALVTRYCPDWQDRRSWLKGNGAELFRRLG